MASDYDLVDDGTPGSPWLLSRDNSMCRTLWCFLLCCFGTVAGIVVAVLEHEAIFIAYFCFVIFIIFALCGVFSLLSVRAWWIKPAYQEFLDAGHVMITPSREKELSDSTEPLNAFAYIGTHNSCHTCAVFGGLCIKPFQYTHASLGDQLRMGIRHIELDIWYNRTLQQWEIWHEVVDPLANSHFLLVDSLSVLHQWSCANREHFPININLDIKGGYRCCTSFLVPFVVGRGLGGAHKQDEVPERLKCCAIDVDAREAFACLDQEIRSVWQKPACFFEPARVLTNGQMSVGDAIAQNGWPAARELKGSALFFLNIYGPKEDLQEEAAGFCFWPRSHYDNHDHIYHENGCMSQVPDQIRNRNAIGRTFVEEGDKEELENKIKAGCVLLSSDSPASYGHHSVLLRSDVQNGTATPMMACEEPIAVLVELPQPQHSDPIQ